MYKRSGCRACALVSTVVVPALQERWGEAVDIEQRPAGTLAIVTPFFFASGRRNAALSGLPQAGEELDLSALEELLKAATSEAGENALTSEEVVWMPAVRTAARSAESMESAAS